MKNVTRWLMCLVPLCALALAGCGTKSTEVIDKNAGPPLDVNNPTIIMDPNAPGSPGAVPGGAAPSGDAPGVAAPGAAAPGGAPATK